MLATSAALLLLALAGTWQLCAAEIDAPASRIGFTLKTYWGQTLDGRLPVQRGGIETLADGRRQVRLQLSAAGVEIVDHAGYTRLTRGRGFFDAARFPHIRFESEPYPEQLTQAGGALAGTLVIRGVARRETFTLEPAGCTRPGLDCDVVAHGDVRRSDYAMDRWGFALADDVQFSLRIRTREGAP